MRLSFAAAVLGSAERTLRVSRAPRMALPSDRRFPGPGARSLELPRRALPHQAQPTAAGWIFVFISDEALAAVFTFPVFVITLVTSIAGTFATTRVATCRDSAWIKGRDLTRYREFEDAGASRTASDVHLPGANSGRSCASAMSTSTSKSARARRRTSQPTPMRMSTPSPQSEIPATQPFAE